MREEKVCWERGYPIIYLVLSISSFFCISIYTSNTDQEKKSFSRFWKSQSAQQSRAHKPFLSSRSQTLSHQLLQDGLCPRLGCKRTAASTRHLSCSKGMGEPRSHKVFFFFFWCYSAKYLQHDSLSFLFLISNFYILKFQKEKEKNL